MIENLKGKNLPFWDLRFCKFNTPAMVEIVEVLQELIGLRASR
ncbi:hypothetical protein [Helicobacter bilis]|nr:hypothetical protein [Helicobacter bilis]